MTQPPPAPVAPYAPIPPTPPSATARALTEFWRGRLELVPLRTLVACAAVGGAGAALLVGQRPGLGVALVGLLLWAPALPDLVVRRAVGDLVLAGLSVALLAVVAVRDAGWIVALCAVAAAGTGAVAATSSRTAPAVLLSLGSWCAGAARALPWATRGVGEVVGSRRAQVVALVRSTAVTAVLLLVFGLLFASADGVFASYLPHLTLDLLPVRVLAGVAVALAAATVAHLVTAPPPWSDLAARPGRPAGRAEWLLPVVALDALVLAFVAVQAGALAGGRRYVMHTAGLTYAEWARRGFAQLVTATALTLLVVGIAARRAPRGTPRDRVLARAGLGVLCLGTLGVVASALRRIDLYVATFGLTRTRLVVIVAEVAFGVVLLLVLAAGVRWRGGWLPRAVVLVAATATLGLAAVNPDAQILRHNVSADVPLDRAYLDGLSADAVPAMDRLDEPLRSELLSRRRPPASDGLAGWNFGRWRAAAARGR